MTTDFESRVLECIPEESELLLIEPMQNPRGLIELDDGRLLSTNNPGGVYVFGRRQDMVRDAAPPRRKRRRYPRQDALPAAPQVGRDRRLRDP